MNIYVKTDNYYIVSLKKTLLSLSQLLPLITQVYFSIFKRIHT